MEELRIIRDIMRDSDDETRDFLEELITECFSVG